MSDSKHPTLRFGVPVDVFLSKYWQKAPRLMRGAIANFACPLSPNDLAGLACEPDALARLVMGSARRFRTESGPFAPERFGSLEKTNWTLLVQDVDQWDDDVRKLLRYFEFLPRWRIEDVMVSYAVTGGSVGAHVDQYDVFLLQGKGQRRWQIDDRKAARSAKNQATIPGAALKLLDRFTPNKEWVLAPGDVLYLPPGVPHFGVATTDDCMTFSIGLRAPSVAEMFGSLLEKELIDDSTRFQDRDLSDQTGLPAVLDHASLSRVRAAFASALAMPDVRLGEWFAEFITAYRAPRLAKLRQAKPIDVLKLKAQLERGRVITLAPGLRAIGFENSVHIGGMRIDCSLTLRRLLTAYEIRLDQAAAADLSESDLLSIASLLKSKALQLTLRGGLGSE